MMIIIIKKDYIGKNKNDFTTARVGKSPKV